MLWVRSLALIAMLPLVLGLSVPLETDLGSDLGLDEVSVGDFEAGEVIDLAEDAAVTSPNVTPVGLVPDATAISTEFASDAPIMYASTLKGIRTYDISDPTLPVLLGVLPMSFFQNENAKLGEREDGTKFLLVGFDLYGATPTYDPTNVGTWDEIVVVDVTDPADPHITARIETDTWTHTVGCANDECTHAFTSGNANSFQVINLEDISEPFIEATVTGQPMEGNTGITSSIGHDWDVDADSVAWWVGTGGIVAYDVSDPADPVILNTSDEHSRDPEWNSYISHNSLRPNADTFTGPRHHPGQGNAKGSQRGQGGKWTTDSGEAHVDAGNVLLLTEEDYIDVTCESEGSFQTWYVPDLDPAINRDGEQDGGTITPLAQWNTEILDTGIDTPAGAFCSAHYFDYHQDGYVAQGWYQQGMRILDVNDATDINQVGYWITGAQETWGAYWVPEYDDDGHQTGLKTDILYTADPTRGMEILQVDLPDERGTADAVAAPILTQWLEIDLDAQARAEASEFGYVCLLPPGSLDDE
jgi:hypothetical protein